MTFRTHFVSIAECSQVRGTAVVIDVIRAFTTAAWAFERGVDRIVLTDDLEDALRLRDVIPGALAMKDGSSAPGFALMNSPASIRDRDDLAGMTIVQRTTHGTIGAVAARSADYLLCAGFVNASATVRAIGAAGHADVYFVVTGEDGRAQEDLACAEYMAALLHGETPDPAPYIARVDASGAAERIRAMAQLGDGSAHADDVALCMEADRFDTVLRATEEYGLLVLRRAG